MILYAITYNGTGQNSYYMWDRTLSGLLVRRFYCTTILVRISSLVNGTKQMVKISSFMLNGGHLTRCRMAGAFLTLQ